MLAHGRASFLFVATIHPGERDMKAYENRDGRRLIRTLADESSVIAKCFGGCRTPETGADWPDLIGLPSAGWRSIGDPIGESSCARNDPRHQAWGNAAVASTWRTGPLAPAGKEF
jgi:hypothetical protein